MKFIFEAKASDYDLAAEQEILLRHVSNRRRRWTIAAVLCLLTVLMAIVLIATRCGETETTVQVAALVIAVILFQQGYLDYTSGNPKAYLKMLYRGRRGQTLADLNAIVRVEITEGENAVAIYNKDGKAGEWDFRRLCRVTESDEVFELVCGGMPRQYLALPKSALREGTVDAFRRHMSERLGGKSVERYTISERRQNQLKAAKYQLFRHE